MYHVQYVISLIIEYLYRAQPFKRRRPSNNYFKMYIEKCKYLKKIRIFSLLLLLCTRIVRTFVEKNRFRHRLAFIIHVGPNAFSLLDLTAAEYNGESVKITGGVALLYYYVSHPIRHNLRSPTFLLYRRNINM